LPPPPILQSLISKQPGNGYLISLSLALCLSKLAYRGVLVLKQIKMTDRKPSKYSFFFLYHVLIKPRSDFIAWQRQCCLLNILFLQGDFI
jgi:hypothetical protein